MDDPEAIPPLVSSILRQIERMFGQKLTVTNLRQGRSHEIYKVELHDGQTLCLRKPRSTEATAISEYEILKFLKKSQPGLQVPAVIHETTHYTLLEYLDGNPFAYCQNLPWTRRQLTMKGLAAFLFSLWTIPAPDVSVGLSYRDWIHSESDLGLRRSLLNNGWGEPLHFLHRCVIAHEYVPVDDDETSAVKHGDLNAWNVLVKEGILTGVIDWDTAGIVPLPATVHHPLFIADIPGWRNDNAPPAMRFNEDRRMVEHELRRLAAESSFPTAARLSALLETSFERQFFELSLRNKRINEEFIRTRLLNRKIDPGAALKTLDRFLHRHKDLRDHQGVSDLREKLSWNEHLKGYT